MRHGYTVLLLILIAIPYVTALQHDFVYDDHGSIVENPFLEERSSFVRALTFRTLADPTIHDHGRPVVIVTYLIDRALWGLRPFGYHATNVLIHLANVLLALVFFRRILLRDPDRPPSPFFLAATALLFGLHPVLTEAIQVPAFREDLLVTGFLLVFLIAGTSRGLRLTGALPALVLALGSKESAVIGPALLLWLWVAFPRARPPKGQAAAIWLSSVAATAFFVGAWLRGGPLQASAPALKGLALPFPANLLTAPWLWLKTLRLLVMPFPLLADYVIDPVLSATDWRYAVGAATLVLTCTVALTPVRRWPWLAFGAGWILLAFLPVSNLAPLYNPFAERYLYLPAAAFAMLLGRAFRTVQPPRLRAFLLAGFCASYTAISSLRLTDWANDYTLWSRTLTEEPRSARAHTWLGLEMKKRGDYEEAYHCFRHADQLKPQDVSALINLGVLYAQSGRIAEAERIFRKAVERRPDKADAHWNLGMALHALGRDREASAEFARTLEIDPRHRAARATLYISPAPPEEEAGTPSGAPTLTDH